MKTLLILLAIVAYIHAGVKLKNEMVKKVDNFIKDEQAPLLKEVLSLKIIHVLLVLIAPFIFISASVYIQIKMLFK